MNLEGLHVGPAMTPRCSGCAGKLFQIALSDIYKCKSCGREHRKIGEEIRDTFVRDPALLVLPLTLREIAERAIGERKPSLAARVAYRLRGKGFDFLASWRIVNEWTGVSRATWSELLRRSDEGDD